MTTIAAPLMILEAGKASIKIMTTLIPIKTILVLCLEVGIVAILAFLSYEIWQIRKLGKIDLNKELHKL